MKFFFCSLGYLITRLGKILNPSLNEEKFPESMFWGFGLFNAFIGLSLMVIFSDFTSVMHDKFYINRFANPLMYMVYVLYLLQYILVLHKSQWKSLFEKLDNIERAEKKKKLLGTKLVIALIFALDIFFLLLNNLN